MLVTNVLVFTNSPKMDPLIVLMVSELITALLRARERRVRELTFKELNEPLSPENFVAESSFEAKELMVTKVSTNIASLTIKELMVIEEAEPLRIFTSSVVKELMVPDCEFMLLVVMRLIKSVLAVIVLAISVLAFTEPR